MDSFNTLIFILLFIVGIIRFIKKAIDIAILIIPPIILTAYTNHSITETYICWFLLLDFLKTNLKIVSSFFNHLFSPIKTYKYKLVGKLFGIYTSALTLYFVIYIYINLISVTLQNRNILDILSAFISSYIFISIVKITYFNVLKK